MSHLNAIPHWQNAIEKVLSLSDEYHLLEPNEHVVLGVSGGPDSVLLAELLDHLAAQYALHCHLAHVNYGLRGEDSDADQALVEELARSKGWTIDVLDLRKNLECDGNFQDWAREQRYTFFREVAKRHQAGKIAVGHHLSDQVETVLQRFLRGSSLRGLAAMRPQTQLYGAMLIRPLLKLTREEVLAAVCERGLAFRNDASNKSNHYLRNRLRHEVLPVLQDCQPGFEQALGESLLLMQADEDYLETCGEEKLRDLQIPNGNVQENGIELSLEGFRSLPKNLRLRVLRLAIAQLTGSRQSITFYHVVMIDALACQGPVRAQYDLPGNLLFEKGPLALALRKK